MRRGAQQHPNTFSWLFSVAPLSFPCPPLPSLLPVVHELIPCVRGRLMDKLEGQGWRLDTLHISLAGPLLEW